MVGVGEALKGLKLRAERGECLGQVGALAQQLQRGGLLDVLVLKQLDLKTKWVARVYVGCG